MNNLVTELRRKNLELLVTQPELPSQITCRIKIHQVHHLFTIREFGLVTVIQPAVTLRFGRTTLKYGYSYLPLLKIKFRRLKRTKSKNLRCLNFNYFFIDFKSYSK